MGHGDAGTIPTILNGMPWWVKAVAFVGFPIFAACAAMYVNFALLQPHVLEMRNDHLMFQEAAESMAYTNFVLCQRSALNKEQAEQCLKPPNWLKERKRLLRELDGSN